MDQKKMARGVELLLRGMGCDLSDPHYVGTPERVARMYKEMLSPRENSWTTFPSTYGNMVVLRGHEAILLCPHHLQPAAVRCYVGYIPKHKILGLSKLVRVIEQHLTTPILQEDLTEFVASSLDEKLDPQGVAVVMAGVHGCLRFRGVRTEGDIVTSSMRGLFLHSQATRDEFMRIVGRP
jgi:GTP cyclohydrolase IA